MGAWGSPSVAGLQVAPAVPELLVTASGRLRSSPAAALTAFRPPSPAGRMPWDSRLPRGHEPGGEGARPT